MIGLIGLYHYLYIKMGGGVIDNKPKFDIEKYDKIMVKIGDYILFNQEDIDFINTLPNDKLKNIIKIYNGSYTELINELLNK